MTGFGRLGGDPDEPVVVLGEATREAVPALVVRWGCHGYTIASSKRATIGSHATADIVMDGDGIEPLHAEVWFDEGWGWSITSLSSTSSSWVDGELFEELAITRPTTVFLGSRAAEGMVELDPVSGRGGGPVSGKELDGFGDQSRSRFRSSWSKNPERSPFQAPTPTAPTTRIEGHGSEG